MKIAFTSIGDNLNSEISQVFGRTEFFILFEIENKSFSVLQNPFKNEIGAAGIQAAQFLISQNVGAVVTGHIGNGAFRFLSFAEISIYSNAEGTVQENIDKIEKGEFIPLKNFIGNNKHRRCRGKKKKCLV
jgi:predicted Fe-Mo cluster-binding NifX family protein